MLVLWHLESCNGEGATPPWPMAPSANLATPCRGQSESWIRLRPSPHLPTTPPMPWHLTTSANRDATMPTRLPTISTRADSEVRMLELWPSGMAAGCCDCLFCVVKEFTNPAESPHIPIPPTRIARIPRVWMRIVRALSFVDFAL